MKTYKKLIIAFAILIVLGIANNVMAWTYTVGDPIADINITSPTDGATVYAGGDYSARYAGAIDRDICVGFGDAWDYVVKTWSGPGSFNPTTGFSTWTAPAADGQATIVVTASDDSSPPDYADDPDVNDSITVTVVYDRAFSVLDDSDANVAIFDNMGNLFLKGTLDESTSHTATAVDEFRIQNSGSTDVAIIDANDGNMYIDGTLSEDQGTLTPSGDDFIVKDSGGTVVAYIDNSGNLYLKKKLYEQVF